MDSISTKLRDFTEQNGPKGGQHEKEFWLFPNKTWMLQTVRPEKVGSSVYFSCFVPKLWSLNCPKKLIFCNFVLTSAKDLNLLMQFICMYLKVLITLFRKMTWFIGVWATVFELLTIKLSEKILTQLKCNKIHQLQTLIFPKQ